MNRFWLLKLDRARLSPEAGFKSPEPVPPLLLRLCSPAKLCRAAAAIITNNNIWKTLKKKVYFSLIIVIPWLDAREF